MKLKHIIVLILIATTMVQAYPHRRHKLYPSRYSYYYSDLYAPRYSAYFSLYRPYRYYTPIVVTTESTTTYPTNLVTVTVESVAADIVDLNDLMARNIITEKDFERAKKTLLNRIGMSINPDAEGATTTELIKQIETLYEMQSRQLLTEKEYLKQKKKLLALI